MERLFSVPVRADEMCCRGGVDPVPAGTVVTTDTYFGAFPCEPYARYTTVKRLRACARLTGRGRVALRHLSGDGTMRDVLAAEQVYNADVPATIAVTADLSEYRTGCLYLAVSADAQTRILDLWYEGEGEVKPARVAVIICTYRREETVRRNLSLMALALAQDPLLAGSLEIFCVDNGGTLASVPESVRLIPNRNFGGSGGYARGMIEAKGCTHLWLMDDDIGIEPSTLRRAVTFLRHRRDDALRLAGGMFAFDSPTVQHEATARFDGYTFHSNGAGLDFRDRASLLRDCIETDDNTYGGWWSMIVPATGALPMPFFIKLDDVEYGLRQTGPCAVMCGFGVWHEAFGRKGNAWTEYYTTRNTLIIQSMYPRLGRSAVKTLGIRLLKALAYGEPMCMAAALQGVEDYLAGPEAFSRVDPEARHRAVMQAFGAKLAADMTRSRMLGSAVRNLLKVGNWRSVGLFFRALCRLARRRDRRTAWAALSDEAFWMRYLGLKT